MVFETDDEGESGSDQDHEVDVDQLDRARQVGGCTLLTFKCIVNLKIVYQVVDDHLNCR